MIGISAQVSLYPLRTIDMSPTIYEALRIFLEYGLNVNPGSMSTLISGDDDTVFEHCGRLFGELPGKRRW